MVKMKEEEYRNIMLVINLLLMQIRQYMLVGRLDILLNIMQMVEVER